MITLKVIYNFCSKILGNPVFQFVYPFLIFGISYLIGNNSKSFSYQIINEKNNYELIKHDRELLGISDEVNIYEDKIAFYNNGNNFIDNEDFINDNHISLSKNGSRILKVKIIKKNRNQLKIKSEIDSLDISTFHINIMNNEVLEQNDVFVFQVIYSGLNSKNWLIESRIKGLPQGIKKGDIHIKEFQTIKWTTIIILGLIFIFIFRYVLFRLNGKIFFIRSIEFYPIMTFIGGAGVMYYEYFQHYKILKFIIL